MNDQIQLSLSEKVKYHTNVLVRQNSSYHLFFWISLYIILILLDNQSSWGFRFIKEFVNVSFFALITYINLGILFPSYVEKKNLLIHILSVILIAALISPIKTAILYLISPHSLEMQPYLMSNLFSIFLSTAFIGLAATEYGIITEWMRSQQRQKELKREKLESELKFLKTQLNPHFLFNTLNSLYALTLKKSDLAPEIVLKLSEAMRYMLYECNVDQVSLSKEIQYIENYLELEKLRHSDQVDIKFNLEGDIDDQKIAPLLFLPFIENSFKHGIATQLGRKFVHIDMKIDDDDIQFEINNNKGTKANQNTLPQTNKISGGIGLGNIQKRLRLLYPDHHRLEIKDTNDHYSVKLKLNLNS